VPNTTIVKMGAALCALSIAVPTATAAAADPAPSPGGMTYADTDGASVFADGSTLDAPVGGLLGDVVHVHGTLAGAGPGDGIVLQRLDATAGWVAAATATAGSGGAFDADWKPDRSGHVRLRAVSAGGSASAATADPAAARDITVFRRARATWYGPGFFGRRTACGYRLTRGLLGVAHKTLPCGTLVELYKDGRTVTVPVVDRGPFSAGASYDLTAATAQALGVTTTTTLGAVRADGPAPTP
jgi:hypothetical protein